jgi:hypothetical protein
MDKFNKKFAQIQLSKVKVYCQPEVFALGCFFEPSMRQQKNITQYLKVKLGVKFSEYGIQNQMIWMCYQWFLPSVTYKSSKFHEVTNRFWKSNNAGTIAHKLPTIRDKDFYIELGISNRSCTDKVKTLLNTKLVKAYVDEAKTINSKYSKIRYVQLNVPLIISIIYSYEDIFSATSFIRTRIKESKFFEDIYFILESALKMHKDYKSI